VCERVADKKLVSGSHATIRLVNLYPNYFVVALDSMEYCASLKNLRSLEGKSNWVFVKVGEPASLAPRMLGACEGAREAWELTLSSSSGQHSVD
jgi:hypothetical protein